MTKNPIIILLSCCIFFAGCSNPDRSTSSANTLPSPSLSETSAPSTGSTLPQLVATGLDTPWDIVFLPNGDILTTQRPGVLTRITPGTITPQNISGVTETSEGGLMGIAIHPQFSQNHWLYLYLTTGSSQLTNQIERYRLEDNRLTDRTVILSGIKAAAIHDGGQIAFGPDGNLYLTTGDAGIESTAQDINSFNGKILRLKDDGTIPSDNPYANAVYSYGHRNPQGIAWDNLGNLWETEHGPSGNQTGYDELNLIIKGGNYGWPLAHGDESKPGLIPPVIQSGSHDTWAPAGLAFANGSLFFTGLKGETLYQTVISNQGVVNLIRHYQGQYGRLRAITLGPDGYLYFSTSNQDGRGRPHPNDDQILKIKP